MNQQRQHYTVEHETGQASLNPEKELLLFVLKQAKDDLAVKRPRTIKQKREKEDAYRWFKQQHSDWFFSFHSLCEQLDMDPGTVRRGIFRRVGIIGPA